MNKKDPRVIKTLRQIDTALLANLEQKSFLKITVDNLCETALINRSTFYKYYQDKFDLLDQYIDRVLEEFRENIHTDFISAPVSKIDDSVYTDLFNQLLKFINQHRHQYQVLWRASIDRQVYEEMTMIIHQDIYEVMKTYVANDKKKVAYCDYYAYLFASNMMALVHWWFMNDNTISEEDVRLIMTSNMKDGLFCAFKTSLQQV